MLIVVFAFIAVLKKEQDEKVFSPLPVTRSPPRGREYCPCGHSACSCCSPSCPATPSQTTSHCFFLWPYPSVPALSKRCKLRHLLGPCPVTFLAQFPSSLSVTPRAAVTSLFGFFPHPSSFLSVLFHLFGKNTPHFQPLLPLDAALLLRRHGRSALRA